MIYIIAILISAAIICAYRQGLKDGAKERGGEKSAMPHFLKKDEEMLQEAEKEIKRLEALRKQDLEVDKFCDMGGIV